MEEGRSEIEDKRKETGMSMTFEDLDAWKKARGLVNAIYALTRDGSLAKDFGLCGQAQRAAVSVMSNVACPVK